MKRPLYESKRDIAAEAAVAKKCGEYFVATMVKMPSLCSFDWLAVKGEAKAIIEIKCRTNASGEYPTYLLSKKKFDENLSLADKMKLKFMLVVKFTDRVMWISVSNERGEAQLGVGGREDRNDPADIEDCVYFNMGLFKEVT